VTSYTYNQSGSLHDVNVSDTNAAISAFGVTPTLSENYAYDLLGRLSSRTSTTWGTQHTVSLTHSSAGRLLSLRYPSGRELEYAYDQDSGLLDVAYLSPSAASDPVQLPLQMVYDVIERDASARVVSSAILRAAGDAPGLRTRTNATYATSGLVLGRSVETIDASGNVLVPVQSEAFSYDSLGRLNGSTQTMGGSSGPAVGFSYEHAASGELTQEAVSFPAEPGWPSSDIEVQYGYDRVGSRTSLKQYEQEHGGSAQLVREFQFGYAEGNKLVAISGNAFGDSMAYALSATEDYDALGRQLFDHRSQAFGWSVGGQLESLSADDFELRMFSDSAGQRRIRLASSDEGLTVRRDDYVPGFESGSVLVHETRNDLGVLENTVETLVLPGGAPIALLINGTYTGISQFVAGSEERLGDASMPMDVRRYTSYGERYEGSNEHSERAFHGMQSVAPANEGEDAWKQELLVAGVRTYDPVTGRFLSPDPLGFAAAGDPISAADHYRYAQGNPFLLQDPTGYSAKPTTVSVRNVELLGVNGEYSGYFPGYGRFGVDHFSNREPLWLAALGGTLSVASGARSLIVPSPIWCLAQCRPLGLTPMAAGAEGDSDARVAREERRIARQSARATAQHERHVQREARAHVNSANRRRAPAYSYLGGLYTDGCKGSNRKSCIADQVALHGLVHPHQTYEVQVEVVDVDFDRGGADPATHPTDGLRDTWRETLSDGLTSLSRGSQAINWFAGVVGRRAVVNTVLPYGTQFLVPSHVRKTIAQSIIGDRAAEAMQMMVGSIPILDQVMSGAGLATGTNRDGGQASTLDSIGDASSLIPFGRFFKLGESVASLMKIGDDIADSFGKGLAEGAGAYRVGDFSWCPGGTCFTLTSCFTEDNTVATSEGDISIADVQAGMQVLSYDRNAGVWRWSEVLATSAREHSGDFVRYVANNHATRATGNHPICVVAGEALEDRKQPSDLEPSDGVCGDNGRWVEARDVRVGDVLYAAEGLSTVTSINSWIGTDWVYNLVVDGVHNYTVNEGRELVHNGITCYRFMSYPSGGPIQSSWGNASQAERDAFKFEDPSNSRSTTWTALAAKGGDQLVADAHAEGGVHANGGITPGISVTTDFRAAAAAADPWLATIARGAFDGWHSSYGARAPHIVRFDIDESRLITPDWHESSKEGELVLVAWDADISAMVTGVANNPFRPTRWDLEWGKLLRGPMGKRYLRNEGRGTDNLITYIDFFDSFRGYPETKGVSRPTAEDFAAFPVRFDRD
jgi:RHS repeat-associated protein